MRAVARPKQIRELMKVDGLTNDEVKSHLQVSHLIISDDHHALLTLTSASVLTKTFDDGSEVSTAHEAAERDGDGPEHRHQRQRRAGAARAAVHRGGRHLVPPPPEYAAAAAQPAGGDAPGTTTTTAAGTVYAPVATLPSGVQRPRQGPPRQSSGCSDGRRSGDASSGSPAVSSSSHTTSA